MANKTAHNDVTGDFIKSKVNNSNFENNFDKIFRKEKQFDAVVTNGELLDELKEKEDER